MIVKGYEKLELSTQILINEALARNIEVEVLDWKDNFIRLKKGALVEYIKQATRTSSDSYISPLIMENKQVTKLILGEKGFSVPKGIAVQSVEEGEKAFEGFLGKDIVIKPKSTNFGEGIIILYNISSFEVYKNAVEFTFKYDNTVLIEEFVRGREFRFLVIGDSVEAILHRVPANVKGDGLHNIIELVYEKNMDPLRGTGYVTPLEKIELGVVEEEYLRLSGKSTLYVPQKDEIVYLRKNSNISTGGDSIDFTDEILDAYKEIAVKAAKAVGAKICGADIIIDDISSAPTDTNYSIIELNFNPALHIHDFPFKGKNRQVEKKVLDLLGF